LFLFRLQLTEHGQRSTAGRRFLFITFPELPSVPNKAIATTTPKQKQAILDGWIQQTFVENADSPLCTR